MELIPIKKTLEENAAFAGPLFEEILRMTVDYYTRIGFVEPWIGYFAKDGHTFVGSAGFKGQPVNGKIEIAYGTFEPHRNKGVGTEICRLLVELGLNTDPTLIISARTLQEKNHSVRILERNGFTFASTVLDPEDGEVWEWIYAGK